jgi:hypothetical protein
MVLDGRDWAASRSGLSTLRESPNPMKNSNKLNGKDLKIIRRGTTNRRKIKKYLNDKIIYFDVNREKKYAAHTSTDFRQSSS